MQTWHENHEETLTTGQRVADTVAAFMGSWTFIIIQSVVLILWMAWNTLAPTHLQFDPAPFIGLNLFLSFEAAYAAPFIMISQKRQTERDRHQAEADYACNVEAERRIEELQAKLFEIEDLKINRILELLGDPNFAKSLNIEEVIEKAKEELPELPPQVEDDEPTV